MIRDLLDYRVAMARIEGTAIAVRAGIENGEPAALQAALLMFLLEQVEAELAALKQPPRPELREAA